jgi:RNA polymerase sigma-70 factor (ECF subfamily)
VYAICYRMTADQERAERLTQDAFVQAWEKLGSFRGESAFGTWLHRLTVNVVLQDQRSRQRERDRRALQEEQEQAGRYATDSPDARLDLERAIATLPDGARTVFVLHDIEGFTHQEIAEHLGIAVGTTKAQLHRARKLLRGVLSK